MFGKNKRISKLEKEIEWIKRELDSIKKFDGRIEIELLKHQMQSLRGLINRRLKKIFDDEERKMDEEVETAKQGKVYNNVILPE